MLAKRVVSFADCLVSRRTIIAGALTVASLSEPPTLEGERDTLKSFLADERAGRTITWMLRIDSRTIGAAWIDLEEHETVKPPSIHIMIGDIAYRGRGIGKAVMQAMVHYTRTALHAEYVYSRNLVSNAGIAHVKQTIGLTIDGAPYTDTDGLVWQNTKMKL